LKEYQPGDFDQTIHWKAFAKGQGIQQTNTGGDSPAEIWLDSDTPAGLILQERLSQLCRW